ncbi:nitrogenase component 1 [Geomonas subterranea]|uniref:Nitrogenase component 1 n=1 Tax=Geomonas subterranea TaxID=2847989 RepID=A0ABX8LMD3_9BACT|nr:nitrogenase component 1 [Geomonas subterranea]QXE91388.1 nitrogenase component 1 [Geomonas subterranea]QXM10525.1 nitrogenase component 1 [Geomonas subterranea]
MAHHTDQKVLPKREDRLRTCHAYGGTSCALVQESRGGCLVRSERSFTQVCNCQMSLALTMVTTIPDAVIIMHAPPGCGGSNVSMDLYVRNGLNARGEKKAPLIWFTSNLDEADVIAGGEEKLEATIVEADLRFRPRLIFVVSTCTPGIIGDDIDAVAGRVRSRVAATVVPLHCEGFKTRISATGYDAVYHGLARYVQLAPHDAQRLAEESSGQALLDERRKSRRVNVFNVYSIGRSDEVELARLLELIGLEARFYPNFARPEAFTELTEASLNVSICATHDDYFLTFLEERYGIPYLIDTMPIGIRNTGRWLRAVAARFGLEEQAERVIAAEEAELERALSDYRPPLAGKRVYLGGGEMRVAATAMLMHELGCEVVGFRAHHYDEFGDDLYLTAAQDRPGMEVNVATTQTFELANLIERAQPDLYLGHSGSNAWVAKLGVPTLPIFSAPQTYLGYLGVFEVARRAVRLTANRAFQEQLRRHTRQPYRESWYRNDPFAYITDGADGAGGRP